MTDFATPADLARHIAEICADAALQARAKGLTSLAYILDTARAEAVNVAADADTNPPGPEDANPTPQTRRNPE